MMYFSNSNNRNKSIKSFADTCMTRINDKTIEMDIFGYLRKTNFNSIVVSNESMMVKAINGKLKWITEYDSVEDLLYKTDKFVSRKKSLPYFIKNVIMVSLEYNVLTFSDLINSLKRNDRVTLPITHKYASEVSMETSSNTIQNCSNLNFGKGLEHPVTNYCNKYLRNLSEEDFLNRQRR